MTGFAAWRAHQLRAKYDVQSWDDIDAIIEAENIPVITVPWLREEFGVPGVTMNDIIFVDGNLDQWYRPQVIAHELYHYLYDSPALAALLWANPDVRLAQMEHRARTFAVALGTGSFSHQ